VKAVTIQVLGKVQGVWFRASTKAKAQELHISGSVRNRKDGSVLIEAEGREENIVQFIEWCNIGPDMATVTNVHTTDSKVKHMIDFKILRL